MVPRVCRLCPASPPTALKAAVPEFQAALRDAIAEIMVLLKGGRGETIADVQAALEQLKGMGAEWQAGRVTGWQVACGMWQ